MSKCYGYVRVSGQGQVEGDGLIRQEKVIKDYCKQNNLNLVKIYRDEGISGTIENRPALAEMLFSLEKNGFDIKTIVIERLDRLARDLLVQETIINDIKNKGFDLISSCEGDDLASNDPTRKLIRQVMGAIAEYDKNMTVAKLKVARDRMNTQNGKCEGRKNYNEVAKDTLKELKRLRRKRKGRVRKTYREISEIMNDNGYKTLTGKSFNTKNVATILSRY